MYPKRFGYYQDLEAQAECKECPIDKFSTKTGSKAATAEGETDENAPEWSGCRALIGLGTRPEAYLTQYCTVYEWADPEKTDFLSIEHGTAISLAVILGTLIPRRTKRLLQAFGKHSSEDQNTRFSQLHSFISSSVHGMESEHDAQQSDQWEDFKRVTALLQTIAFALGLKQFSEQYKPGESLNCTFMFMFCAPLFNAVALPFLKICLFVHVEKEAVRYKMRAVYMKDLKLNFDLLQQQHTMKYLLEFRERVEL
jgi:hypothetical protein